MDHYAPLQNSLLLGPLPILLPPTNSATSDVSHSLTHIAHLLTTTSLLRGLPQSLSNRKFTIPRDIAVKHKLVEEQVFRQGDGAPGFKDACFEIGTRGMDELITTRSHLKESGGKIEPQSVMPLFLGAVSLTRYFIHKFHFMERFLTLPLSLPLERCRFRPKGISNAWRRSILTLSIQICKRPTGSSRRVFGGLHGLQSCSCINLDVTHGICIHQPRATKRKPFKLRRDNTSQDPDLGHGTTRLIKH